MNDEPDSDVTTVNEDGFNALLSTLHFEPLAPQTLPSLRLPCYVAAKSDSGVEQPAKSASCSCAQQCRNAELLDEKFSFTAGEYCNYVANPMSPLPGSLLRFFLAKTDLSDQKCVLLRRETWASISKAENRAGYEAAVEEYKAINGGTIFDTTSIVLYISTFLHSGTLHGRTRCVCMMNPFWTNSGIRRHSEVPSGSNLPLLLLSHDDQKCKEAAEKLKKFLAFCCSSGSESSSPNPCHSYEDVQPAFLWVRIRTHIFSTP